MRIRSLLFSLLIAMTLIGSLSCGGKSEGTDDELWVLETSYGRIVIEFFPQDAPKHVAQFKKLAKEGFFNGTRFHRLIKDKKGMKAIQGGDPNTRNLDNTNWGQGEPGQEIIEAEFSKTLTHRRTAVSAARLMDYENSATSQFFIVTADSPEWDGTYSIFGRVIDGMKVVDLIVRAPVYPGSGLPMDAVVVNNSYIARRGEVNLSPKS